MHYRNRKTTIEQKEEMVRRYQAGESLSDLGKFYGIGSEAVRMNLKRRGVVMRDYSISQQKYTINQNYFEKIDSHEKAQILGMLYADGCNMVERGELTLALKEDDEAYVKWVKECLGSNKPLRFIPANDDKTHKAKWALRINNKKICHDLINLGCVPRKSLILKFPSNSQIPEEFLSSFILGYFEGDGCIMPSKNRKLSFACSKMFADGLKEVLSKKFGYHVGVCPDKKRTCFSVTVFRSQAIYEILSWAYSKAPFKMDRKYKRFIELQSLLNAKKEAYDEYHA